MEEPSFREAPTAAEQQELSALGNALLVTDQEIKDTEAKLERLREQRFDLTSRRLPDYMRLIGQDKIGLMGTGYELVLEPFYHANISAEWPEERRERAFQYLIKRGDGDLIKVVVTYEFRREQLDDANWLIKVVQAAEKEASVDGDDIGDIPAPSMAMAVPWNTLTAFVREQVKAGNPIDLDVLGATIGEVAKLKKQRQEK